MRPAMLLEKLPVPEPSVVLLLLIEGPEEEFQQIPRAVTEVPPSLVILPPLLAVVVVIDVMAVVVRVGAEASVVIKFISFPYTVTFPSDR